MMRAPIDFFLPLPQTISDYIERSEALLQELHHALEAPFANYLTSESAANPNRNLFKIGEVFREPIFYGGESAYTFQYRDLAALKYGADANWLWRNKGIDLEVGRDVCQHVAALLNDRLMKALLGLKSRPMAEWTMLPAFAFSCDELAARAGRPVESVRAVVEAFAAPESERNSTFTSLHDCNSAYASAQPRSTRMLFPPKPTRRNEPVGSGYHDDASRGGCARAAIAAVLWVPAEQIGVRDNTVSHHP